MRRAAVSVGLILCAGALVYWWWSPADPASAQPASADGEAREPARGAPSVAPERMNAILSQPVQPQRGSGAISGRVISKGEPVVGATVTATRAESEDTLSELGCHCDNACGRMLLECGCGEASEQLKTLVAERRGEVVPIARTVTGADGSFELTRLDPGEVALWADSSQLGTALKQHVAVGASKVDLELGTGATLKGRVTIDGAPAPANAWVTAIHGEQSRFFDVLTQADGTFSIGPLPLGRYSLVAGAPGALAGHEHLRKDTPTAGLELSLYSPRTISGAVELDGKPASGVAVKIEGNHREDEAVSAGEGLFRFTLLRPGTYQLSAIKGRLRADVSVRIETKKGDPKAAVLSLAEGARLVGSVRGAEGPIKAAKVKLFSLGKQAQASTGPDGRFELTCFTGDGMNVEVKAEGFVKHRQNVDLRAGEETVVDILLEPETAISGAVVDEDGAPISEADIAARRGLTPAEPANEERTGEETVWAKSDDAGLFVVRKIKVGDYRLVVSRGDHRPAETTARAPASGVQVQLTKGLSLSGQVVNEAGKPVRAKVRVWSAEDLRPQAAHETEADSEGNFRVHGLAEGKQSAQAEAKEGKVTEEVSVSAKKESHVRLVLETHFAISGTVVDVDGKPVESVMVHLGAATERGGMEFTKETGAFEFVGLKAGEHRLSVYSETHEALSDEPLRVKAGSTGVRLVVKARLLARGRVVDSNGKPVPKFIINLHPFDDPGGAFEVPVAARSELRLRVTSPGYLEVTKKIRVAERDLEVGDIVIGGRAVRIRAVAAATGQPIEKAELWSRADWGTRLGSPSALTGKDGWATLRGVPSSSAEVVANHEKYAAVHVKLGDAENERVVQLEPGATWVINVVDPDGRPVKASVLVARGGEERVHSQSTDKTGKVRLEGMSAGSWAATAFGAGTQVNERYRAKLSVELPKTGEVVSSMKLTTGPIALGLTFGLPPGDWGSTYAVLLPPDQAAPTSAKELTSLGPLMIFAEPTGKPGEFRATGVFPGRQIGLVFLSNAALRRHLFFTVPIEVSADPKQSFTFPAPPANALIDASREDGE